MRAMVLREHGGMDRLTLETDFPDPTIGARARSPTFLEC